MMDKIREAIMSEFVRTHDPTPNGQEVNGAWYAPKWGCDTLDQILENVAALSEIERLDREADSAEAVAKGLADQLASARAEIERLKADRAELQTYIEEIVKLEASLGTAFSWADLREFKEATRKIAQAALAQSAPEPRESAEVEARIRDAK